MTYLLTFMNEYGYLVLFLSLILGIMALPIPIEAVMGYAGLLSYQGHLNWIGSILAAAAGCSLGMVFAYLIGYKLGMPFFEKYGHRIHLGPERLQATSNWFKKYGNKLLIVALFIPGVRHITGYFSGITRLPIRIYILYSAVGSLIWVSTFILLGKMLGPKWQVFQELIKRYLIIGCVILAIGITIFYLLRKYKNELIHTSIKAGKKILTIFHSRKRAELFLVMISLVTIGFMILMVGIIEDYLSNEINDFDKVTNVLVSAVFKGRADFFMSFFLRFGTDTVLMGFIFCTLLWIFWKGREKRLETYFLCITIGGGGLYEELLRRIFHSLASKEPPLLARFPHSFPSEQSLMAFVIYGFFFFLILRHSKYVRVHTLLLFCWASLLLLIGISRIYFDLQTPSQIAAGYVFGGVWLGLSTLLLEFFRMLTNMDVPKKRSRVRTE